MVKRLRRSMDNMDNMDTMDDSTGSPAIYAVRLYMDSACLPTVLRACSPQRHMTPQAASVTEQPAARLPTVPRACSPQRHMTPQTGQTAAKRQKRRKPKRRQENANTPAFLRQVACSQKNLRKSATSADKKCLLSMGDRLLSDAFRLSPVFASGFFRPY